MMSVSWLSTTHLMLLFFKVKTCRRVEIPHIVKTSRFERDVLNKEFQNLKIFRRPETSQNMENTETSYQFKIWIHENDSSIENILVVQIKIITTWNKNIKTFRRLKHLKIEDIWSTENMKSFPWKKHPWNWLRVFKCVRARVEKREGQREGKILRIGGENNDSVWNRNCIRAANHHCSWHCASACRASAWWKNTAHSTHAALSRPKSSIPSAKNANNIGHIRTKSIAHAHKCRNTMRHSSPVKSIADAQKVQEHNTTFLTREIDRFGDFV